MMINSSFVPLGHQKWKV